VSAGRRWQTVPSKQHRLHLLFLTVHETVSFCTKHVVSFKRKWRQNMSHFNQVLNCNFIFKNQFNCISAKFKCQPWSWPPFSFWFFVSDICNFIPNEPSNFQSFSIWLRILIKWVPRVWRLLQIDPWLWIFSI
jgi:hypothetical protein